MHAWIAMAFGDADNPYADIPSSAYAYDDRVQNHKQVQVGDLLFLRNRAHLEGIGRSGQKPERFGHRLYILGRREEVRGETEDALDGGCDDTGPAQPSNERLGVVARHGDQR